MIGEALRLIRVFNDEKLTELSKSLNVSAGYLSEIENMKKTPTIALIKKYSQHFKIRQSAIMFFMEELEKNKNKANLQKTLIKFLQFVENANN